VKTITTGLQVTPVKTVVAGFEAKPLETVTTGFEAKPVNTLFAPAPPSSTSDAARAFTTPPSLPPP
jgi:hypothetical protein